MKAIISVLCILFIFGCSTTQVHQSHSNQITNSLGMTFVTIKAGTFKMGIPAGRYGHSDMFTPVHDVTLTNDFLMQTTEVTQKQWKQVMGDNPSQFKNCGDCPVESVSYNEVKVFIQKLNEMENTTTYRLPTDAEWEFACRAGSKGNFSFGKCLYSVRANFKSDVGDYLDGWECKPAESRKKTTPVKTFIPNKWGLYDMHGNVAEWCEDTFGALTSDPAVDPISKDGTLRITRGGGWKTSPSYCLSGYRNGEEPDTKANYLGFRLVQSIQ